MAVVSETPNGVQDDNFDLYGFLRTLWEGRWLMIVVTCAFAVAGIAYAYLATEWFKADVVMVQADDSKSLSGNLAQLGGLASLAGINIGSGSVSQTPIAVLKSRELVRDFIADKNLIKVLLVDKVDPTTGDWKIRDPEKQPDIRDAVEYFQKKVCTIVEDKKAGVVTLSITWRNSAVSAEWANELAQRVNAKLRDRATSEAERNIKYLKEEMVATNVTALQDSLGKVLQSEMQKLLLARGNDEFAFKVVDRAVAPRRHSWPNRISVAVGSVIIGILVSIVALLIRREFRARSGSATAAAVGGTMRTPGTVQIPS
jgi:uncharacterized protein involved in exopolysaccharide biosynthesis